MKTLNIFFNSARIFRPFVCILGALLFITFAHARTLNLSFQLSHLQFSQIDPNYPGESYYTVGVLLSTDTTNLNDEVDSPDLSFVGTETGDGETYFGDLPSVLEAITNGSWTLYVNKGSPVQQQYSFTVSATGVTTNDFSGAQIYIPADGATGVPTNTSFSWSGPTNWNGVQVVAHSLDYSFYTGASFPASTTEWPSPALVPPGTNEFEVTCMTNGSAWFAISTPTNASSKPFTNWVSDSTLATFVQSGFVVGPGTNGLASFYSGHTLLAHYTFDDDTIYTADTSGHGNDITGSTGNGGASTIYITNNAAAGPYAAAFYAPQNPDYTYSGAWLIPPTNLLATLAGSFSASLWLRSTDVFAGDTYPAADGEGLLTEDYTIIFTNNINYSAPGNVIPMALTGHKLAFLTGDNVGGEDDTLHSTANIDTGAYVHLVVTRNQVTGEKKIYVNGQLDASDIASSAPLNTPQQIAIGALELVPLGGSLFSNIHGINGELDDIQIYSGVLASNEVAYIFSHPGSPAADVAGPQEDPLAVSLNAPQLVWITSGDALWFPEAATNFDGLSAAQSGAIGAGQSSVLQTVVTNGTGASTVSFEWQTETMDSSFTLTFYVDGQVAGQLVGSNAWTAFPAYTLGPGTHTLKWVAAVNAAGTSASLSDAGWVDVVRLAPVPVVYASDSPTVGQGPLTVQFTSPSTDTLGHAVTSRNWYFGDGAVSQLQSPTHTYTNIGTYFVSLATYDSSGASPITVGLNAITVTSQSRSNVLKNLPGSFVGFTYNSFTNPKSLQFLGTATNATTGDGAVLQLAGSVGGQAGAAFIAVPLAFGPNVGFSTFFTFRMSKPGGLVDTDGVQGGDGIAFLIQSAGYVYGTGGGGIGYEGISNSLAVEFDTWNNGTQNGIPGDINGNHVAVNVDGVLNDSVSVAIPDAMNNGNVWYAWIDYEGVSQDLEVRLSEIPLRPLAPTLDLSVNLPAILGTTNAFVGFTGGTGAAYNEEDVLAWKFAALPSSRFTGTFSFTNVPAGFSINYGIVLAKDVYTVAGHTFTNYSFVPLDTISNANAKIAFASKIAELAPPDNFTLPDPNSLEIALSNNAVALDAADFMTYAVFASYVNSDANVEGAVLNTYDNGTGFSPYMQNADYSTRYPGYESDYVNSIYNMNQNSYPGLNPDPSIVALAESGARLGQPAGQQVASLLAPADPDGNYDYDSEGFTVGTELGAMVTRRQLLYSPPLPLNLFSARGQGTNFVFDFGTVSNQSYTVWGNTNITSTNWTSLTNILGDGYIQKVSAPLTNRNRSFYRVSSP